MYLVGRRVRAPYAAGVSVKARAWLYLNLLLLSVKVIHLSIAIAVVTLFTVTCFYNKVLIRHFGRYVLVFPYETLQTQQVSPFS